jgi:hypothetical protein
MNDKKILKYAKELGVTPKRLQEIIDDMTPKRLQEIIDDINFLTDDEEESLSLAMKSPRSKPMNAKEMMNWLEK